MIYQHKNSYSTIQYLTLEESYAIDLPQTIPILESTLCYLVSYDNIRRLSENYDVDDEDVINYLSNINHIQNLSVMVEEYDIIDMEYNPNLKYVISPLSESDFEYLYIDSCIYLSEAYKDDRYLYLLEDLDSFDESIMPWIKNQIQTGKNIIGNVLYGETPQQREIRTGEGHKNELATATKETKNKDKKVEQKVQELKNNENGNNNWHSFNPNDKHEEKIQKQNSVQRYYNRKKDDYDQYRSTGASGFKSGKMVAKEVGKDALELAKKHKKITGGIGAGIATAGLGAIALKNPNIKKRITALKNRIMGLEEKNKQGRFSKIISKLKAILNRLISKFKRNNNPN